MADQKTEQKFEAGSDIEPPEQIKAQLKPDDHPSEEALPEHVTDQPLPQTEQLILPPKRNRQVYIIGGIILVLIAMAATAYFLYKNKTVTPAVSTSKTSQKSSTISSPASLVQGLQLDPSKNYGDKYASGVLPVGDNKYSTTTPAAGTIYVCQGYAHNLTTAQGGAGRRGPWFVGTTQYDINKKLHVQGSVAWQASFSNKVSGSTRTITTNDLPNHKTGTFPISPTDPSYAYDRNPNLITAQSLSYSLSAAPAYGAPQCMGGQSGIMLSGVALFNGFDAAGRDAGAWEIQDSCDGHPEKDGLYHYHTLSSCITDVSVKTVIGFALDGFPITGPKLGDKNFLTTSDLDACHGLTSQIIQDGKTVTTYHYVMTQDFPYSVSCFRAKPITPPGQSNGVPANQQ